MDNVDGATLSSFEASFDGTDVFRLPPCPKCHRPTVATDWQNRIHLACGHVIP